MRIKKIDYARFYEIDNKGIEKIVVYGSGKKIFETGAGWLVDIKNFGYDKDITGLDLNEIKRANKENLNRQDNYYILSTPNKDNYNLGSRYTLYIHESNFEILEEFESAKTYNNGEEKHIYNNLTIKNKVGKFDIYEKEFETVTITQFARIEKTDNLKRQEELMKQLNENYKYIYKFEQVKEIYTTLKNYFEKGE